MNAVADLAAVRTLLEAVGFSLVQTDAPVLGSSLRADAVGWAGNEDGELVPWIVVESKRSREATAPPLTALVQLGRIRDALGTVDHYLVLNGRNWFRADPGMLRWIPVAGPQPPVRSSGRVSDLELATSLLNEQLWREVSRLRHDRKPADVDVRPALEAVAGAGGQPIDVNPEILWRAQRSAMLNYALRLPPYGGEFASLPTVAQAVAHLAGSKLDDTVLDPFCGMGSFLWECVDYAQDRRLGLNKAAGYDINERSAGLAKVLAGRSPVPVEIHHADSTGQELPEAKCVVSAPPLNMRFADEHLLLDGSRSRDGNVVVLDRILRALGPEGRAVVQMSASLTFQRSAERYRDFIAHNFRVAAILGLPGGSVISARVPSVLLVIERGTPGPSFVGQVGLDWETQLAPGGAALMAAVTHVEGL